MKPSTPLISTTWPALRQLLSAAESEAPAVPTLRLAVPLADDAQLLRRLADGDPNVLGLIYDRYAPSLFRVLSALLRHPSDVEDALQEVFASLATAKASRIRDLRAYLFATARREAYDTLRKRRRESGWTDISELDPPSPEITHQSADWASLLSTLPLEQREVIALKIWEGMTFAEIATIVSASQNTVASRYRYGIEKLRSWCQEADHAE